MQASPFSAARHYRPAEWINYRGAHLAAHFSDPADEYAAARGSTALFDRSDRGLVRLTGKDRKPWLHNLITNAVKPLADNAGCYAFAIDLKGRIQFDLNVLAVPEALLLDIDAAAVPQAIAHLNRYQITEDVSIVDVGGEFARLGVAGPSAAAAVAGVCGDADPAALPLLSSVGLPEGVRLVRNDFAGLAGFELILPRAAAAATWDRLAGEVGIRPAGFHTLDVLRCEAGIPWLGRDLDEHVLPPETGQIERGVSYNKGCYLGQEVVERMRSHGAVPRRLVRLRTADGQGVTLPASIFQRGAEVGRVTSLVRHPAAVTWVGLGYLRASLTDVGELSIGNPPRPIAVPASGQ
jgi:folate-binding protein YgfZ